MDARFIPADTYFILANGIKASDLVFTSPQVCELLEIPAGTLRGWVSKGQFPPKDGEINGKTPIWHLKTVFEYVRNAPGGRLPYQVQ